MKTIELKDLSMWQLAVAAGTAPALIYFPLVPGEESRNCELTINADQALNVMIWQRTSIPDGGVDTTSIGMPGTFGRNFFAGSADPGMTKFTYTTDADSYAYIVPRDLGDGSVTIMLPFNYLTATQEQEEESEDKDSFVELMPETSRNPDVERIMIAAAANQANRDAQWMAELQNMRDEFGQMIDDRDQDIDPPVDNPNPPPADPS